MHSVAAVHLDASLDLAGAVLVDVLAAASRRGNFACVKAAALALVLLFRDESAADEDSRPGEQHVDSAAKRRPSLLTSTESPLP